MDGTNALFFIFLFSLARRMRLMAKDFAVRLRSWHYRALMCQLGMVEADFWWELTHDTEAHSAEWPKSW